MPELRVRLAALVAIVVAASTGITEAPAPEVSAELADLHARAELGDPDAQVSLGFRYRRAHGLLQDDAAAARWFRAAVDGNSYDSRWEPNPSRYQSGHSASPVTSSPPIHKGAAGSQTGGGPDHTPAPRHPADP